MADSTVVLKDGKWVVETALLMVVLQAVSKVESMAA